MNKSDVSLSDYDQRHGGAFDRGAADSYYGRPIRPHYFENGTYSSPEVREYSMTPDEVQAYMAGYQWNEKSGNRKEY